MKILKNLILAPDSSFFKIFQKNFGFECGSLGGLCGRFLDEIGEIGWHSSVYPSSCTYVHSSRSNCCCVSVKHVDDRVQIIKTTNIGCMACTCGQWSCWGYQSPTLYRTVVLNKR